jgi:peptidoglycan/LPS O-acetylase OafA/YrhL
MFVVALASWQLAVRHATTLHYATWAAASGSSLFVLTGLVHEASHRLLCRRFWLNELLGNLAGWMVLTPLSAYRAFHLKHHQRTNRGDDPNKPLNSRWMLAVGSLVYASLIHLYACRNLRGRLLVRYLLELAGMAVLMIALYLALPRAVRDRVWLLPLLFVMILQNIRIVTEHLDLPSGRYHDTWQLSLPGWLSRWLLHYDHHLEHHLRPGLHWYELPAYRTQLGAPGRELGVRRVTLARYVRDVLLSRPLAGCPSPRESSPAPPPDDERGPAGTSTRQATLRADTPAPGPDRGHEAGSRRRGLDAMRGATMCLVVVLHAALAYVVVPIPNLIWAVHDEAAHPAFDLLCWWTLGISSPFYLLSGFFAVALCESRGLWGFLANRAQRILGPMLVAGVIILPATFFVWVSGWLISGRCTLREFLRMKFHAKGYQENLYGPAHLWSLEYLAVMLAAYALFVALRSRSSRVSKGEEARRQTWLDRLLASPWRPLALAVPTTLILWGGHRAVGLDAMMDRLNAFVPEPFRLLHNAVFFVVGVRLHRLRDNLGKLATNGWTYSLLSFPVFAVRAVLIRWDLVRPLDGAYAVALAASGGLFCWLLTFGLLGLALGVLNRPRPALRYLADSSYWVYLIHLPIVGLLQVDLYPMMAPAALKFSIVLSVTLAVALASYQVCVRHTVIGVVLHGRRERSRSTLALKPHLGIPRAPRASAASRASAAVGPDDGAVRP